MGKHFSCFNYFRKALLRNNLHFPQKSHKMDPILDVFLLQGLMLDFAIKHRGPESVSNGVFLEMVFFSHSFPSKLGIILDLLQLIVCPLGSVVQNHTHAWTHTHAPWRDSYMHSSNLLKLKFLETKARIPLYSCCKNDGKNNCGYVWNQNFLKGLKYSVKAPKVQRFISYDVNVSFIWSAFSWK